MSAWTPYLSKVKNRPSCYDWDWHSGLVHSSHFLFVLPFRGQTAARQETTPLTGSVVRRTPHSTTCSPAPQIGFLSLEFEYISVVDFTRGMELTRLQNVVELTSPCGEDLGLFPTSELPSIGAILPWNFLQDFKCPAANTWKPNRWMCGGKWRRVSQLIFRGDALNAVSIYKVNTIFWPFSSAPLYIHICII